VNHESFDELKQPATGMDTGQWHAYYEAYWSNLLLRLKERLENEPSSAFTRERDV
jgi:hypothetical protein